ncbi:Uncharacterised protein [Acinetobacter baumannii]|uniref:hypothetical protein n=1 Tax=Acinetobacter baumannii TaxID=470 RepID=UPI000DE747DE|nr:hypothetical protein [Acinetobacter baumannii]SSU62144.1 Uncharacterised protein [Acinetobacter baumannii]
MKPEQFIREYGVDKAREVVDGAIYPIFGYDPVGMNYIHKQCDVAPFRYNPNCNSWSEDYAIETILIEDLEHLVESLDRYNKFENKQEALDAITNAPEGSTHYRKLSCGTRYIKQGPRFFEYWNGSEWCRPTVPFTDETHILRFDKLEDLKLSIKDHESIYGGGDD